MDSVSGRARVGPEQAIKDHGLLKRWVAEQMGLSHASVLSRLLAGESEWTPELSRAFARAIGMTVDAIDFAHGTAFDAENPCEFSSRSAGEAA